jgi:DNA-binding PadR family transcriptional regulator
MAFWFGLEEASIYSVLRTLAKNGHAKELPIEQPGNRPQRTRYAITASGRRYYRALLVEALTTTAIPVTPFDVALAARGDLDPTTVSESIAQRLKSLHELEADIARAATSSPSRAMVDRNLAVVRAERLWLEQLGQRTIS